MLMLSVGAVVCQEHEEPHEHPEPASNDDLHRKLRPDGSGGYRSIVTYLGTDFILPNGCPLPECDENNRFCRRDQLGLKERYDSCLA